MQASPSPTRQVKWRVFLAGFPRGDPESAEFTRRCDPPFWAAIFREEGGWFTGEPGRALACLYSEARLCKGAREASLSQPTTPRSTGNISVREEKLATATHVEQ